MKVVTIQNIQALYALGYRLVHVTRDWIFEAHVRITSSIEGYPVEVVEGEAQAFLPKDLVANLWRKALGDPELKEVFIMVTPVEWEEWVRLAKKAVLRTAEEARLAQKQVEEHGQGSGKDAVGYVLGITSHPSYDTHGNYHGGGAGYGGGGPGGSGIH